MKMNKNIAASVMAAAVLLSATAVAVPNGVGTGVVAYANTPETYSVTVASGITNGSVSATPTSAAKDAEITVTVTPDDGYEIGTVTYTPAEGNEKTITADSEGAYKFTMPEANVTVSATFTEKQVAATKHEVKFAAPETGGTATVDKQQAAKDEVVTITATPTNAETHVAVVTVTDSEGKTVETTKGANNTYTFDMPDATVTVTVEFTTKQSGTTDPDDSGSESTTPSESDTSSDDASSDDASSDDASSDDANSDDTSTSTPVTPSNPTTPTTPSTSTSSTPAASDSSTAEAPAVEFKPAEVVVDEAFSAEEAKVVEEIKIEAPEGTFAEGTKLSVKPDTKVTAENSFALDISFELDGAAVQPKDGAAVTVSVPVPPMFKDVDESTLKVFYFDGTNYTKLDATVTNGVVTFKTNHFSTYVISTEELAEKNTPASTDPNPITGVAAMAALPVVALAGAVIIAAKKRK